MRSADLAFVLSGNTSCISSHPVYNLPDRLTCRKGLQIASYFRIYTLQELASWIIRLRQRKSVVKYATLIAIIVGVCCSLALIKSCSRICCDFGGQQDHAMPSQILGQGFQYSIRNLAAASKEDFDDNRRWTRIWTWGGTVQDEVLLQAYLPAYPLLSILYILITVKGRLCRIVKAHLLKFNTTHV